MNFNQKAHLWESISISQQQAANDLVPMLTIKNNEEVLDVGCGTGYLTEKLHKLSKNTYGMDIAENMVKVAKELRPHIHFSLGDAEQLNLKERFDWIITNAVTYYFKDMAGTFKNFHNALKVGGKYALQSQTLMTPQFNYAITKLAQDEITRDIFTTFTLPAQILDIPELVSILEDQAFIIKHTQLIDYQTEYTIKQAVDIFKSGAVTQYLNPKAYAVPLSNKYIERFWQIIEIAFKDQAVDDKIILRFPRCFIVAEKR